MEKHRPTGSAMAKTERLQPGLGVWNWRHKGWELGVPSCSKEVHMGRVPKAEQMQHDLLVERLLSGEGLVLAGKQVGNKNHCPWIVYHLQGSLQIGNQLEDKFSLLP